MVRYVIRGVTNEDEGDLLALAQHLNTVNLPFDQAQIREIIDVSVKSFSGQVKDPRRREYTFVLHDLEQQRVIGTSKILAQLGRRDAPYIFLDIIIEEKYSPTLDRHFVHKILRLGHSYEGPTEIGGLVIHPDSRRVPEKLGMMISYVRFMFMALHRGLFRNEVVAELLPPLLPDGRSHLWEALGRRFTDMTYLEADLLSKKNKEFIRSLFPSGDIYATLLSEDAQDVIGKVGKETRGVEKLLRRIGFQYCNRIDPFDGGPHFRAATDEILLIKRTARTRAVDFKPNIAAAQKTLVSMEYKEPPFFKCIVAPAFFHSGSEATFTPDVAAFFGLEPGAEVGTLPLD